MFVRQLRAHYEERRRRAEAEGHSSEGLIFVITLACDNLIRNLEDYATTQRHRKFTGRAENVNREADRLQVEIVVQKATQSDHLASRLVRELYKHYKQRGRLAVGDRDEVHLLRIALDWVDLVETIERSDRYVGIYDLLKSDDV